MNINRLESFEHQLYSTTPIFGAGRRRRAAEALARDGSPDAVRILAEAVAKSKDAAVRTTALKALDIVDSQNCIDAVCATWHQTRHPDLEQLIISHGWVSSASLELRVLTSLVSGKTDMLLDDGPEIIPHLLKALEEDNLAEPARSVFVQMTNPESQQELCRLVVEEGNQLAARIVSEAGYEPSDESKRALFFFITGQWDKYETLDPECALIRSAYQEADENLKKRITERIRQSGRVDLFQSLFGDMQELNMQRMTDEEWEAVIDVLTGSKKWDKLWKLVQEAPPVRSARIFQELRQSKWVPEDKEDQEAYRQLLQLSKACSEKPESWQLVRRRLQIEAHSDYIEGMTFTPDGRSIVSWGYDGNVCLWSFPDGKLMVKQKAHSHTVSSLAIAPDGSLMASRGDINSQDIRLWSLPDCRELRLLSGETNYHTELTMSGDGKILASAGRNDELLLWSLPEGDQIAKLEGHRRGVSCIAFSPDSRLLITGDFNKTLRLWKLPDVQEPVVISRGQGTTYSAACSPDGKMLAAGVGGVVCIWGLPDLQLLMQLDTKAGSIHGVEFTSDSRTLYVDTIGRIRMWSVPEGTELTKGKGVARGYQFAHTSDFKYAATTSGEGAHMLIFRRLPDGKVLSKLAVDTGRLLFSPDGEMLISASEEGVIQFWASELKRVVSLPIANITLQDVDRLYTMLEEQSRSDKTDRAWIEFVEQLVRWRCRFDVDLNEVPPRPKTESDIEIED